MCECVAKGGRHRGWDKERDKTKTKKENEREKSNNVHSTHMHARTHMHTCMQCMHARSIRDLKEKRVSNLFVCFLFVVKSKKENRKCGKFELAQPPPPVTEHNRLPSPVTERVFYIICVWCGRWQRRSLKKIQRISHTQCCTHAGSIYVCEKGRARAKNTPRLVNFFESC